MVLLLLDFNHSIFSFRCIFNYNFFIIVFLAFIIYITYYKNYILRIKQKLQDLILMSMIFSRNNILMLHVKRLAKLKANNWKSI
jgi:hypothetical protein